jgi:hypothetical protein
LIGNLIERLSALVLRRPRTILAVAFVIVAIAALIATRIKLDPDVLNLIPEHNREVNEFRTLLRDTGTLDLHIVVMQFPKGADPTTYTPMLDAIGEQLRDTKLMSGVSWKIPDPFSLVDKVIPYSMLVLTPQQVDEVAKKLSDQGIRESVARNAALLQTPQATVAKQIVRVDPFNLAPIYLDRLRRAGGNVRVDFSSGYYIAQDQSAAVIIARPHTAAQQLPFSRQVMDTTRSIVAKAEQEFRAANPNVPLPAIGYTGGYAIAASDEKIIRRDMTINSITSMLGVLLLYLYAYRRPHALLYAAVPMGAAIIITFAIGALMYGTLSAASTGFAALLTGLGIDFMTVLYERYVDERNRGANVTDAVKTLMHHAMPGVIVGALTTAATFYAFLITEFRGMTELGFLTGSGIVVFLLATMFVFTALLVVLERRRETSNRKLFVHAFGSGRIVRWSLARRRTVIIGWIVVVALTGVAATRVEFSDSLQNLRAKGNEGVRLQQVVTDKFGQTFESMMYGVRGATASEAIAKSEKALPDLERIAQKRVINSYDSIAAFLPSEEQQRQVIARLVRGENDAFDFERIERTLRAALEENGFRATAYDEILPLFRQALAQREPLTVERLTQLGLGESIQRFIRKTSTGYLSIIYVYPVGGAWPRFLPAELQEFRRNHPEGVLTGINLISETLRTITHRDALRASVLGFVLVFALLWVGFRSFWRACFVFVPFIAGCTCMLGFMAAFDLQFNFMNVFVGLMLVGTATDYAVYMLQRYDENPDEFHVNATETGRAVVLAALMSIVGFASFAMSQYPGVRSIGYAAVVGVALSCLASITLLPALLATGKFRREHASFLGEVKD